jgi:hypothetical protein
MSSMVVGGYKSVDVVHLRGGYRKPIVTTIPNFYHKDGHYVRPNIVAFKYLNFKKDADPNAHVRMFNYIVIKNAKTSKEYIINAFSYMLKDTTSN